MSEWDKVIGGRARELRTSRKTTLDEVSTSMGISTGYLALLEKGQRRWNTDLVHKIAIHFNVDPALFQDEKVPIAQINSISELVSRLTQLPEEKVEALLSMIETLLDLPPNTKK